MISFLIPTRRRRSGLERAIQSALNTASDRSSLEFIAYIDEDDVETYANFDPIVQFVIGPRIVLSNMWNKCAAIATGDILHQSNDDCRFNTPGWDAMVENAFQEFPDKILLVHGSDGSDRPSGSQGLFGPHPFIHRRWVQTLGYFTPPYFSSDYGDTWLGHLAEAIGRRRYLPLIIEHMHHWLGKADIDETTSERLDRHSNDSVERLYRNLAPLREIDIDKLKAAMK